MGLGNAPHFVNYHRVLSKARWSGLQAAKIFFGLLVALVPVNLPIIIGVDDTIERRKGKNIKDKGCYRDPVRSTKKHVIRCFDSATDLTVQTLKTIGGPNQASVLLEERKHCIFSVILKPRMGTSQSRTA